jgi:hypothetical protein
MGESKVQQIKKKMLQASFDKLEQEYIELSEQLNYTDNAASQKKLERQLKAIEKKMQETEQELNSLRQSEITRHPLVQILSPNADSIITHIKKAYQACCPEGFSQQPDTVEGILEILQDIRDNAQFAPIERFVGHLVVDSNVPQHLVNTLQEWGRENIQQFDKLLNDIKQVFSERSQISESYLLVKIKASGKKSKSNQFQLSAWLIPDVKNYQPEMEQGYKQLYVSDSLDDTFTLDELPEILNSLLDQSDDYPLRNLTLEFFLPYELLSHPVDRWIKEEYGYPESIGKKYRVSVRAYERLDKKYRSKNEFLWRKKWQKVKQVCKCRETFVFSQNHNLETLRNLLDEAVGLLLTKFPESTKKDSIFSVLLITATPVAICLRQELKTVETQDENLIDFLECCILELPESVRKKRLDASQDKDDHIGHHLSLVWEDPERLTPDAEYFYSLPQSVS